VIGQKTYDCACDWIILLDSDAITAEERADFVRWLNREPENAIAFEEMSQLWARMDTLGSLAEEPEELFPMSPGQLRPAAQSRNFGQWVLVASLVIAVMCGGIILGPPAPGPITFQQFVTALNQSHRIVAEDGSVIELGPVSSIDFNYSRSEREIHMQRGSVLFDVAHEEDRPFVVNVGMVSVLAMGTRFRIVGNASAIEIQVMEGSVRFSSGADQSGSFHNPATRQSETTLVLSAGQSLHYNEESRIMKLGTLP
jgi:transmembrane sensor